MKTRIVLFGIALASAALAACGDVTTTPTIGRTTDPVGDSLVALRHRWELQNPLVREKSPQTPR